MLFSSYTFVLVFAPLTIGGYHVIGRFLGRPPALLWLLLASLFFYGWWNPNFLPLLLGSIAVNLLLGRAILAAPRGAGALLALGVALNLAALGYFKYAGFLATAADDLLGTTLEVGAITLPLAISFFTFQQIAFLADCRAGLIRERLPAGPYALFVSFFPQLIAGPIVHYRQIMPQFRVEGRPRVDFLLLAGGLTLFAIGLCKKVLLADRIAPAADQVFDAAAAGQTLSAIDAWLGTFAYSFQIYFDFSGYSDMALGLGLMLGVRLPANFDSPYKATGFIDFWRRWHITLSHFLRDYLYVPLGGGRRGPSRQAVAVTVTMLLGGLWHGAGWSFLLWGALHGLFIVGNHLLRRSAWLPAEPSAGLRLIFWAATFLLVSLAWIPFRATDLATAAAIFSALGGGVGEGLLNPLRTGGLCLGLLLIVVLLPNGQELLARRIPQLLDSLPDRRRWVPAFLVWSPNALWAWLTLVLLCGALLGLRRESPFLYFQF